MSRIGLSDLGDLDRDSDVPLYQQISDRLLGLIQDGILISGDMLPSGPELSRHFAVAPMTVREALHSLRRDGRIVSEKGRGVYVSSPPPLRTVLRTMEIHSLDRPPLIGAMPPLPVSGADGDIDMGAIDIKVEPFASASWEARKGLTGRVTIEFTHGDDYALSQYTIDWRSPLDGVDVQVGDALAQLRLSLESVDQVSESISARVPTSHEISVLSIPRDLPVLVTSHRGLSAAEEVARAETIRDSRFPINLS